MPKLYITRTGDKTIGKRQEMFASWLNAARHVASRSNDKEARIVASFLFERSRLGIPLPHDEVAYVPSEGRQANVKSCVFIAPILTSDAWRLPPNDFRTQRFAFYGPAGNAAAYHPATRTIYVAGEWQPSETWGGNLLLHEGLHAYDRIIRARHMPKPYWRREANAWRLEYRILCSIGGQRFHDFLDKLAPELKRQFESGRLNWKLEVPNQATDYAVLDELLGQAIDSADYNVRTVSIRLCAVVQFCERQYGPKAPEYLGQYVRETMHLWF